MKSIKAKKVTDEPPSLSGWIISLGIPSLVLGIGVPMMGYVNFWWGVAISAIAIVFFTVEWLRKYAPKQRVLVNVLVISALGGSGIFLLWLTFRPVTVKFDILPATQHYTEGVEIGGLHWQKSYSGSTIVINNQEKSQITNIDLLIKSDAPIVAVGAQSQFSHCGGKPYSPGLLVAAMAETSTDGSGQTHTVPVQMVSAEEFRVFCDRVLGGDSVELTVATGPRLPVGGMPAVSTQTWLSMKGSFDALGRQRSVRTSGCLVKGCLEVVFPK